MPYYAYRSHFTTPNTGLLDENDPTNASSSLMGAKNLLGGRSGSSGAVGELQAETPRGGIPQPTPANAAARPTDPRFKLLEINPAGIEKDLETNIKEGRLKLFLYRIHQISKRKAERNDANSPSNVHSPDKWNNYTNARWRARSSSRRRNGRRRQWIAMGNYTNILLNYRFTYINLIDRFTCWPDEDCVRLLPEWSPSAICTACWSAIAPTKRGQ